MKTEEFRIGNWVRIPIKDSEIIRPSYDAQIQSIGLFGMLGFLNTPKIKGVKWSVKAIMPIPLTEEWLKNFGFVYSGGNGYKSPTNTAYWHFSLRNGFIPAIWAKQTIVSDGYKGCNYVHELQNLYFALTGKEI